jgi:putative membrane protein
MMGYGNGGGWMWAFGGVIMLGVLVLIVVAVWAMITVTKRHGAPVGVEPFAAVDTAGSARTRQILDERYARGELSTEDYTERAHARILRPIPADLEWPRMPRHLGARCDPAGSVGGATVRMRSAAAR